MKYLIDVLKYQEKKQSAQEWIGVFDKKEDAEKAFDLLAENAQILSAALSSWEPTDKTTQLPLGSWGTRSCAGVPMCAVLKYGERSSSGKNALNDWAVDDVNEIPRPTSPAPGFKLSIKKLDEEQSLFLKRPWDERPNETGVEIVQELTHSPLLGGGTYTQKVYTSCDVDKVDDFLKDKKIISVILTPFVHSPSQQEMALKINKYGMVNLD